MKSLLLAAALLCMLSLSCPAEAQDLIGGVARTVEDIGGQIVGNPAARRNDRVQRNVEGRMPGSPEENDVHGLHLQPESPTPTPVDLRDLEPVQSDEPVRYNEVAPR